MRTLKIIQKFDPASYGSPHELILNGNKTGVRWNGDTEKELYGDNPASNCAEEFAMTLVSELDYDLKSMEAGLTMKEMACFHKQVLEYLNGLLRHLPD